MEAPPWNSHTNQYRSLGYRKIVMLNSAEHEILNAHQYQHIKKLSIFQIQIGLGCYFVRLINVEMPTITGILTFMSRKISCSDELSMKLVFVTSGPELWML